MSDMRTKILMGTTIASIAVLLGGIFAIPAAQSSILASDPVLGMFGHATVLMTHPDGTQMYMQTDNITLDAGILAVAANTVTADSVVATGPYNFLGLRNAPAPAASGGVIGGHLTELGVTPSTNLHADTSGTPGNTVVTLAFPTVTICDGTGDLGPGCADGNTLVYGITLDDDATGTNTLLALDLASCNPGGCAVVDGTTFDVDVDVTITG